MKCNKPMLFGKSVRIFPLRLILILVVALFIYKFYLATWISSKTYLADKIDKSLKDEEDDILNKSDMIVSILMEDRLQLNTSNKTALKQELTNFLRNINSRIIKLETKIKSLEGEIKEKSLALQKSSQSGVVFSDSQCTIPFFEGYAMCEGKVKWMQERWKSDPCYATYGVDGSVCSIVRYLSEVENFCPRVTDYKNNTAVAASVDADIKHEKLKIREDFSDLYNVFGDDFHYEWIQQRIKRMENKWLEAAKILSDKPYFKNFQKKKILVHPGLLADEVGWDIPKNAFKGGPLGELVQWSDIIASTYVLGHDVTLLYSSMDLKKLLDEYLPTVKSNNCPIQNKLFDVMYMDISAIKMLRRLTNQKFHLLHCELRVVDSFGTEPEYNHPPYAQRRKKVSDWGKWDLNPKQFNTMFPHTPDNTFLGFVIEKIDPPDDITISKENIAVVYGKRDTFWKNKEKYLDAIQEVLPLHATVAPADDGTPNVPSYVINHGVLPGEKLHALLRSARIFVGLGFPFEGPAPLEAIADGAVFINPIFTPKSRLAVEVAKFYEKKPTSRRLSSQHPYAEHFIGSPHVKGVDMTDTESVKKVIKEVLDAPQVKGYMPYEFTALGMLERVAFLLQQQQFCGRKKSWPPLSSMQAFVSDEVSSCTQTCSNKGLICEPHFFPDLNQRSTFKMLGVECEHFSSPVNDNEEIDFPSYEGKTCYIQGNHRLYSCAGHYTRAKRICPCRDYVQGQVALCKDCFIS